MIVIIVIALLLQKKQLNSFLSLWKLNLKMTDCFLILT